MDSLDPATQFLRTSPDAQRPCHASSHSVHPPTEKLNQGTSNRRNPMILTRRNFNSKDKADMCINFSRSGRCDYGDRCIFIHGSQGARRLSLEGREHLGGVKRPRIQNMVAGKADGARLCRWFSRGEECPYAEKCTFLHERLERSSGDVGVMITRSYSKRVAASDSQAKSVCLRPAEWKTKLCHNFSMKNYCPYGSRCNYAHGQAELRKSEGICDTTVKVVAKDELVSCGEEVEAGIMKQQLPQKQCYNVDQVKKIVDIYADWIDDPLVSCE